MSATLAEQIERMHKILRTVIGLAQFHKVKAFVAEELPYGGARRNGHGGQVLGNERAKSLSTALHFLVASHLATSGFPVQKEVHPGTARSLVLGKGYGAGANVKDRVYERLIELGWIFEDKDSADAFVVGAYELLS